MSFSYLTLIIVTLVIGMVATARVNGQLKKYSNVPCSLGITAAEAVNQMLRFHGVQNVGLRRGGSGQDFFDPRTNTITLSSEVYDSRSITAIATACHETGHACQYAMNYTPMRVRGAIVPAANFASNAWIFILILGIALNLAGLVDLAIIIYAIVVVFELVTLPVEFNASHRALDYLATINLPASEQAGARSVLRACANTYVAAALASALQLLWLLGQRE